MAVLIGGLLLVLGFMFYASMWTTYGQYLFDSFIVPQVDSEGNRKADVVKRLQAKKDAKANDGKGKNQAPVSSEPKNRAANRKPANQNTYNSSYKRKNDNNNTKNNKKK